MRLRRVCFRLTLIMSLCVLFACSGLLMAKEPLVGGITREQLFESFPGWARSTGQYAPKEEYVQRLRRVGGPIEIVVFLGTWCAISESEIPKFLKVYELAGNPSFSMKMYGVDQEVKDGAGLSEKYRVRRVPTILFFRNADEIGRIVEYPKRSMEEDFWEIVKGS